MTNNNRIAPTTIDSTTETMQPNESNDGAQPGILGKLNNLLLLFSFIVDETLTNFFRMLGRNINARPWTFIAGPVFIVLLCSIGFLRIELESDPDELYTPQSSPAFGIRDYYEEEYGGNPRSANIFVTARDNGDNLASKSTLLTLMSMHEDIMTSISGSYRGTDYTYPDVCYKNSLGVCAIRSVLLFWNFNRTLLENDANPFATMAQSTAVDAFGRELELASLVGDTVRVENGEVTFFQVTREVYDFEEEFIEIDGGKVDPETDAVELAIHDYIDDTDFPGLNAYIQTFAFEEQEAERAITGDLMLVFIGCTFLVVYGVIVLTRRNLVSSHGALAVASMLAVGLSIAGSFGLTAALGVKFSLVINALIFLLAGLGMDDTFVLVSAFMDPDVRNRPTKERIEESLAKAGASITVTSVTDLIAFLAGSNSDVPAIQDFCYYAAIGVTFDFFLQVTLFVAIMIMSARRENKGKYDFLCCITASEEKRNKAACSDRDFDYDSKGPMRQFLGGAYADFLLRPGTKIAVLVFTAALLGYSAWAYTKSEVQFDIEWFTPLDSPLHDAYDVRDEYFPREGNYFFTLTKTGDYSSAETQQQLQTVTNDLNDSSDVISGSCINWWPAYYSFMNTTSPETMIPASVQGPLSLVIQASAFYGGVVDFLNTTDGQLYRTSFAEPPTTTEIRGTKIQCQFTTTGGNSFDVNRGIDQMEAARDIAEKAPNLDSVSYSEFYLFFDGMKVVEEQLLTNIGFAVMGVFIVSLVLLGGLYPAILVLAMIISIDLEVFGSFYYWGVDINYVSAINLVVAVGLSVDACAHICYSFLSATGTRNERAKHALDEIGPAVTNGLISTLLVLVPLILAKSFIFQIFLRCFFSIIIHSLFHGVVVFPVVLSLVGPASYVEKRNKLRSSEGEAEKEKTFYSPDSDERITKNPGVVMRTEI